jgi:hypothetical protein
MKQTNEEKAVDVLRRAGFTVTQIDRLSQLRRSYATSESNLTSLDYARLRFVRWLVTTGRLTNQIAQQNASSKLDQLPLDYEPGRPTDQMPLEESSSKLMQIPLALTDQIPLEHLVSRPDQRPPKHTLLQYVQWFLKTIMTHDIWYVLSHRPSVQRQKARSVFFT